MATARAAETHRSCSTAALLAAALLAAGCAAPRTPYLDAAEDAARWVRVSTPVSPDVPAVPGAPAPPDLYYGMAGIVLFQLEAHHATGDARHLADARERADALLSALPSATEPGLYTGIAGIGFALLETAKATGEQGYRDGARSSVALLRARARPAGGGIEWNDKVDVIAGSAGTGLFLLRAAGELADPSALELAVGAGRRLVELGRPEAGGLKWAMDPGYKYLMPGFSHGTAGVCFFLASLYGQTHEQGFLDAALAGARYLLAVADTHDDGCLVFHHEPEGLELFYYGWCHGPAGTSRLFRRLQQVTGDDRWQEWVRRGARSVMRSGLPEQRSAGFWNNMSQCCGDAGVAEWFLDLHRWTSEPAYLAFAQRVTAYVLDHAQRSANGMSWVVAERRVAPTETAEHVGYMLGAAGFGMLLLHCHEQQAGIAPAIVLPDSPW